MGHVPLPQRGSDPYYRTHRLPHTVRFILVLSRPSAGQHNANTIVHFACFTYTANSVAVYITKRSRVPGAINSPKPNYHSVGMGNASMYIHPPHSATHCTSVADRRSLPHALQLKPFTLLYRTCAIIYACATNAHSLFCCPSCLEAVHIRLRHVSTFRIIKII